MEVHVAERHLGGAELFEPALEADDILAPIEIAIYHDALRRGTRDFIKVREVIGMLQRA